MRYGWRARVAKIYSDDHSYTLLECIYWLRVQDKVCRAGARVFLENTNDSGILKRDGEIEKYTYDSVI